MCGSTLVEASHGGSGSQDAEPAVRHETAVAYRRYVMPHRSDAPPKTVDVRPAAYNEYLAGLAADDAGSCGEGTR
ncbi:MAG: hypothetical protein JWO57_3045 [Pseudonocardiales bacterium]|nr:hypothetical protein [Pseudonocardiales bacterium]